MSYTAWGDSLTSGGEGWVANGQYPQDLQQLLGNGATVNNEGVGGQTSTEIGVREGGIQTTVSVAGGIIPASTPVAVSFTAGFAPVTDPYHQVTGTVAGVHGTITMDSSGALIFSRSNPGESVNVQSPITFVVDTPHLGSGFVPIFWEGRNDARSASQTVIDNISKQVAFAQSKSYLVLGVIDGNYTWEGQYFQDLIIALNQNLASVFQGHYLAIRSVLVSKYDASNVVDVADYNHNAPPTSLRAIQGSATLATDIGPSDTTFPLNVTAGVISPGYMLTVASGSDCENMKIISVSGNTVTVIRGVEGNQEAHPAGSTANGTDLLHLNGKGYQIVAEAVANWFKQQQN